MTEGRMAKGSKDESEYRERCVMVHVKGLRVFEKCLCYV